MKLILLSNWQFLWSLLFVSTKKSSRLRETAIHFPDFAKLMHSLFWYHLTLLRFAQLTGMEKLPLVFHLVWLYFPKHKVVYMFQLQHNLR